MQQWLIGVVVSLFILTVSAGVAQLGGDGGQQFRGLSVFVWCGIFAFAVQWILFIHAWSIRSEKYFDLAGSLTYVTVFLSALLLVGRLDLRSLLIVLLVLVWALRLGPFLYSRIKAAGHDKRFVSIRNSFPTFLMTWTLQGGWVYLTGCAGLAAVTSGVSVGPDWTLYLGFGLWCFGFIVEVVADRQKTAFRAIEENSDRFISTGLWAWSRHPNYFGEIVLWLGIAIIAFPALQDLQIFTMLAPLWVILQMTVISGTRMLEPRADKKWGNDEDYQAYKKRTPLLMLWPPRR